MLHGGHRFYSDFLFVVCYNGICNLTVFYRFLCKCEIGGAMYYYQDWILKQIQILINLIKGILNKGENDQINDTGKEDNGAL